MSIKFRWSYEQVIEAEYAQLADDNFSHVITEHELSVYTQDIQIFFVCVKVLRVDLGRYSV